ncbi:hypothetical protein [Bradyrhizobium sp.]|uniref:hypothetical protein n=1 Tax=Bradyrhizobium sp. TaxID=376 RepID=UPI003C71CCF9
MKYQIVEAQPVAGGSMKVVGAAHSTKASAEAALKVDKTCAKQLSDGASTGAGLSVRLGIPKLLTRPAPATLVVRWMER